MGDTDAPDVGRATRPRGVRARLVGGLGQSLGGNVTAFGYSVTITASFGAVELGRGAPGFGALAFVSIVLAIAAARGLAAVLSGAWAWFGAAFGASLVFALVESVEFMLAHWLQERRGEPVESGQ